MAILRVRALDANLDMQFGMGQANYLIDSSAAVAQIIGTRLRLWQGQWFLDLSAGVPWLQRILGKGTVPLAGSILKGEVLASPGVQSIETFSTSYDGVARAFTVEMTGVQTMFGPAPPFVLSLNPPGAGG